MFGKRVKAKYAYYAVVLMLVVISGFSYMAVNGSGSNAVEVSLVDRDTEEMGKGLRNFEGQNSENDSAVKEKVPEIYVHVCGEVVLPDVYKVPAGSRLFEVVALAGGLTDQASETSVNLARVVQDGEKIYVPSVDEVQSGQYLTPDNGKVSINEANLEQLMQLSGIGESKAQAIIDYRNTHGRFKKIEDIMLVSGIKEAMYNKIKEDISL